MASLVLVLGGTCLTAAAASFGLKPSFVNACNMSFCAVGVGIMPGLMGTTFDGAGKFVFVTGTFNVGVAVICGFTAGPTLVP